MVVKYLTPFTLLDARAHLEHTENTIIYSAFPYTYETVYTLLIIIIIVIIVILIMMMIINILFDNSVWNN